MKNRIIAGLSYVAYAVSVHFFIVKAFEYYELDEAFSYGAHSDEVLIPLLIPVAAVGILAGLLWLLRRRKDYWGKFFVTLTAVNIAGAAFYSFTIYLMDWSMTNGV
ncbi:hypothetical protein [Aliamphritea spongicola]|uniref:hypothetical protein n=1 Tax=Aliamphritea spongicola TaxID=707589 RepID=UPI00196B5245|nr:hypothetical protein [Aliamphritea spongicola]MBN3561129.1 hypothetical protein [Aliamphritea spongicola]